MLELAQLAPLHQQLDTNYPENLRTVAEWLFVQLVEDEESVPTPDRLYKLATLALRQTERLSAEEGGRNFYLGYTPNFVTTEPASVFNGFNTHEIPVNWTMRLTAFALNPTTRVWIPTACTPATVPDLLAQITHPETSGVTDHALLTNRNHTNAHNIASITGLQTALDNLAAQTGFGFIVLDAGDPVPGGTPAGTKILRRH